jgi:Domain of unknown function (DUF4157)
MEQLFSQNFQAIRIHTDLAAQREAMSRDAKAVTEGPDIFFGPGQYQPGTSGGRRLLLHELAHVVQQAQGLADGTPASAVALEKAAKFAESGEGAVSATTPSVAAYGAPQASPAGPSELHFFGGPSETGVGVLYIRDWNSLTQQEQQQVRLWLSEADQLYGAGIAGPRQTVSKAARSAANQVARAGRGGLQSTGTSASGHTPDVAGGGEPMSPQIDLPRRVNSSIGGQWKRYKPGFRFTGISAYDESTGNWIYLSPALEHEPPPATPGPPVPITTAAKAAPKAPTATSPSTAPTGKASVPTTAPAEPVVTPPKTAPPTEAAEAPLPTTQSQKGVPTSTEPEPTVMPRPSAAAGRFVEFGTDVVLSIIFDLIAAKYLEWLDKHLFRERMRALGPEIDAGKQKAYDEWVSRPGGVSTRQPHFNIRIRIQSLTQAVVAGAGSRLLDTGPLPEFESVTISESDVRISGEVVDKLLPVEGASYRILHIQTLTYSEPVQLKHLP